MKRNWIYLCVAMACASAGAESAIFYAPHRGVEVRDTSAKTIPAGAPQLVHTANGITFNIFFQDIIDNNNIGFDGPDAADAIDRVEDCLTYMADVLNEAGTLDVVFDVSETDSTGFLAAAGTYFPLADGFFGGSTLQRLHDPQDDKPFVDTEEIFVVVDFGYNWNFGTGNATISQIDFQSVLLHEFTHGLGFSSLVGSDGNSRIGGASVFTSWDTFIQRRTDSVALISGAPPAFQGVLANLTSNNLKFGGSEAGSAYQPNPAPGVYAPASFASGSSMSHWDTGNIVGGAVMEHAISSGETNREYSAVDIGALRDIGYLDAEEPSEEVDCTLDGPCPTFEGEGSALLGFLVANNLLPPFVNYYNVDLENIPGVVMLDSFELALFQEVLCNGGTLGEEAGCAFNANLVTLASEGVYPLLSASEHYVAALLSISSELQVAAGALGLTGNYQVTGAAKAIGEPLSPDGDPDGDGLTNQEEYDNVIADGGTMADYVEAALNPLLDGSSASAAALPLVGVAGAGALLTTLAGIGIAALRRKRNQ